MIAACRTTRAASMTCVNIAEDGGAIGTGPALGPSGTRGAHGEPWLWQTEEMVMGFSFLPPSSHSVCSPSVSWAAPPRWGTPIELSGLCLPPPPPASSSLWPPPRICRGGKKSFWQLLRRWWQPGAPRRTLAAEALPCAGRARFFTRIFILTPRPGEVSAPVAQNRSDLLPFRARAWWQPGGGGRTLFFWSSLSASGAGPLHREMLMARPPRHTRVRRPPLESLWWFPLATASFLSCHVVNWCVWLDRLWDQQILSVNWDVRLQHKQTPPPSLNKLPEWDSYPYLSTFPRQPFFDRPPHARSSMEIAHCSRVKDRLRWNNGGKQTDKTGKSQRHLEDATKQDVVVQLNFTC